MLENERVTVQRDSVLRGFSTENPEYSKQKSFAEGKLRWIFARNYEGTE